jgi:hypothetical protein
MNHAEWLASLRQRQHLRARTSLDADMAAQIIDAGFRSMAKSLHPDLGGSHDDMIRLNDARDELRRSIA